MNKKTTAKDDKRPAWIKTEKQKAAYDAIPKEVHERADNFLKNMFVKPVKK